MRAHGIALTCAHVQAWDRFVYVYKVIIKNITHFSLEMDPEEWEKLAADSAVKPKVGVLGIMNVNMAFKVKCVQNHLKNI